MSGGIETRAAFDGVRYANCWEDASLLLRGFEPLRGRRMVSICSAGDNTLALLLLDPSEVVAVDIGAAQLACLHLRIAAFRKLDHEGLLAFLGVAPATSARRLETWRTLRAELPAQARAWWDAHPEAIAAGVVHCGRFETYFASFRKWILPLVQSEASRDRMISFRDVGEQIRFYGRHWNNWRWRLLFRIFFSRTVMGRSGRDPEFFRYVQGPVSRRILERTERALTTLPGASNPWLQFIVSGNFRTALPPYLEPEAFPTIRDRLDRIRIVHGTLRTALDGHAPAPTAWNLSDIFEYMDPALFSEVLSGIVGHSAPGSRLGYWNMLAPRRADEVLPDRLVHLDEPSKELFAQDRAFFYSDFRLDEVRP